MSYLGEFYWFLGLVLEDGVFCSFSASPLPFLLSFLDIFAFKKALTLSSYIWLKVPLFFSFLVYCFLPFFVDFLASFE